VIFFECRASESFVLSARRFFTIFGANIPPTDPAEVMITSLD
jgi:hypothetical protein